MREQSRDEYNENDLEVIDPMAPLKLNIPDTVEYIRTSSLENAPERLDEYDENQLWQIEQVAEAAIRTKDDISALNRTRGLLFMVYRRLAGLPEQGKRTDLIRTSSYRDEVRAHRQYRFFPSDRVLIELVKELTDKGEPLTKKEAYWRGKLERGGGGAAWSSMPNRPPGCMDRRKEKDITPLHGREAAAIPTKHEELTKETKPVDGYLFKDDFTTAIDGAIETLSNITVILSGKGFSYVGIEGYITIIQSHLNDVKHSYQAKRTA